MFSAESFGLVMSLIMVFGESSRIILWIVSAIVAGITVFLCRSLLLIDLFLTWEFQGVVLIKKNEEVVFKKSTLSKDNPQFLCASVIKQMTSVLVLREVQRGTILLNEKANRYLGESQRIDNRIEIRHLLSHSSGLQNDGSVRFTPGTSYEYSNRGYIVLGSILENVTKSSFSELAQNLFTELGLSDSLLIDASTLPEIQEKHPNFVLSNKSKTSSFAYIQKNGKRVFPGNSCGGLISTAENLCKWNYQLHEGIVLSHDLYTKMITPQVKSNFPEGYYGYGICRYSQREIYHIGYVCGYKSTLSYFPKSKISLVILENTSCDDYDKDFRKHLWIRWFIRSFL